MASLGGQLGARSDDRGSPTWFFVEMKLNNYGYIPGAPKLARDALPDNISDEDKCVLRWGPKRGGKFWYASKAFSESPRMRYRVEKLYQVTHQRPIGKQRAIGLGFARGLIAEKQGYAVNWASFAAKQCRRGRRPFETLEELKARTLAENGSWRGNEVFDKDEEELEGSADDWEINRMVHQMNARLVNGYNLKDALGIGHDSIIAPPMYGGLRNTGAPGETGGDERASGDDESSDGDGSGDNSGDVNNNSLGHRDTRPGVRRTVEAANKWSACPMSPSPGFPDGARQIEAFSDSDDSYGANPASDSAARKASPDIKRRTHNSTVQAFPGSTSSDPLILSQTMRDVYDSVHQEMEQRAARNGFEALPAVLKLAYLKEWEVEFEGITRKRKAEDDARAQWIAAKRWRAHYPESPRSEEGVPSRITPNSEDCFDEDAEQEPTNLVGVVECRQKASHSEASDSDSLDELVRVAGAPMGLQNPDLEDKDSLDVFADLEIMSPYRFNHRRVEIPLDTGGSIQGLNPKGKVAGYNTTGNDTD